VRRSPLRAEVIAEQSRATRLGERARRGCHVHPYRARQEVGTSGAQSLPPPGRLWFVVAPAALAAQFTEVAVCLAPAPNAVMQLAVAEFLWSPAMSAVWHDRAITDICDVSSL
jgi:hypothetical protein